MKQRTYMFDSPKLITEVLESIPSEKFIETNVEIVELPRPDCGDLENIANQRDSMFRMMMEEMRHRRHMPHTNNDIECENHHKEKYSKCYVLVIKCCKDFDFAVLDDLAWMNGGISTEKPTEFFYEKADKIVTLVPNFSLIENAFGNKENYSEIYDCKFGR